MTDALTPAATSAPQPFSYTRQTAKPREWGQTLSTQDRKQIHETAQKFEAMYVSEMMNYMFEGTDLSESGFGGGTGEKMYQSLLVNEYSNKLSQSGQAGIAPVMEREMLRLQELQRNPRLAQQPAAADKLSDKTTKPIEDDDGHAKSL